jgi:hypothetical protein
LSLQDPVRLRVAVALVAVVFLLGLATRSATAALLATLVWLVALGTTRRLVDELGPTPHTDPLLLVSPFILVLLALAAVREGALRHRTALSAGVLALSGLSLLESINPLQGSLFGGIAGLLFILVPMLAFWIGRYYVDDSTLAHILKLVAGLGIAAAIYGLVQISSGFPTWDRRWIDSVAYVALNVDGVIRPFGSFSSASEYGVFLALAVLIWLAMGRRLTVLPITIAALGVLIPAIVLESSRGVVIGLVVTLGVLAAARSGLPLLVSAAMGVLLLVVFVFALRHYGPTSYSSSTNGALLSHQLQGLANPLNPQDSTAGIHLAMIRNGIVAAFKHPAGEGIGTVTIAGAKFGGVSQITEADPSDAGVALGLPGLIAFVVVFIAGMRRVYGLARQRRDGVHLAALGVVTLTALQWLNGGQYAVAVLPWLVLGWADRSGRADEENQIRSAAA